jgi:hypothetical protein
VHNSSTNRAPSAELRNCEHRNACLYLGFVVSELLFRKDPYILWHQPLSNQCLTFRQTRVRDSEMRGILMAERLY